MKIQSDHLEEVKQGYFEHAGDALKISFGMIVTSMKMLVHAFSPDTFRTAASDFAKEVIKKTDTKKNGDFAGEQR